jgi:hypothetical protein
MVQMYLNNTNQASGIGWPSWNWKVMLIYATIRASISPGPAKPSGAAGSASDKKTASKGTPFNEKPNNFLVAS